MTLFRPTFVLYFIAICAVLYVVIDVAREGASVDKLLAHWHQRVHASADDKTLETKADSRTAVLSSSSASSSVIGRYQRKAIMQVAADDGVKQLKERLQPRKLLFAEEGEADSMHALQKHQFLHLHHMKTGGTSLDGLVRCGMARLKELNNVGLNYTNLHECGEANYRKCVSGESEMCQSRVVNAAVMSYCAPLKDLGTPFQWLDNDSETRRRLDEPSRSTLESPIHAAVTVLRHPVARVWSMYRFQTKNCYQCRPLLDVYKEIDSGNTTLKNNCRLQLLNHQTRNLMSHAPENEIPATQNDLLDAVMNMHRVFTMVGLTEDMPATATMAGMVFPWLAEQVSSWDTVFAEEDSNMVIDAVTAKASAHTCPLEHRNASPRNNHCGKGGRTHMDLPDVPDEATAKAIMEHNALDADLYQAATERFALQKLALGLDN